MPANNISEPEKTSDTKKRADVSFGILLKGYLLIRTVFYAAGIFCILGALFAAAAGATDLNDLVSNATGLEAASETLNDNFTGLRICMYVQAGYTAAAFISTLFLLVRRSKLAAATDLVLFAVFAAVFFIFGSFVILTNGSAWIWYFLLNPVFSFTALIAGKYFRDMPAL